MEQSKLSIVNGIIHRKFSFLEKKYDYSSISKEVKSTYFDETLHVEYCNIKLQREINIKYTKSLKDEIATYAFSMSITRLPYKGVKDYFSLNVYFKTNGITFLNQLNNNFSIEGAELILDKIVYISMETDDIRKMIEGTTWLDAYYPDWN